MSIMNRFSTVIYRARTEKGITQEQAAENANITVRWYQYIEKGARRPSCEVALELIAFYEIDGKCLKETPIAISVFRQEVGVS